MIQIASDKQKEGKRQRRVEIGMFAAMEGLGKRHAGRQQDRQRDRHIHVQRPDLKRGPRMVNERLASDQ